MAYFLTLSRGRTTVLFHRVFYSSGMPWGRSGRSQGPEWQCPAAAPTTPTHSFIHLPKLPQTLRQAVFGPPACSCALKAPKWRGMAWLHQGQEVRAGVASIDPTRVELWLGLPLFSSDLLPGITLVFGFFLSFLDCTSFGTESVSSSNLLCKLPYEHFG